MLRRLSFGYVFYKRDMVCNCKVRSESTKEQHRFIEIRRVALPEMEEEAETRRVEAPRWLRSSGTTLLPRAPPRYNTPPPIFILFSPFSFAFRFPRLIYFPFLFFKKIQKNNHCHIKRESSATQLHNPVLSAIILFLFP